MSWASDVMTAGDPVSAWRKAGHSAHPQPRKMADEERRGVSRLKGAEPSRGSGKLRQGREREWGEGEREGERERREGEREKDEWKERERNEREHALLT